MKSDGLKTAWTAIKDVTKRTFKKITDPFYAGGAAEVAFFLLLSVVPTTIILAQLLHLFTISLDAVRKIAGQYIDADVMDALEPVLGYKPSGAFGVILFILALWAGSKALFSLMRMSDYAYKGGRGYKNAIFGYIRERLRALVTILLVLVTFIFALYVLVFGEVLVRIVLTYINDFLDEDYSFSSIWYTLRWAIAFLLYFFMVATIYYIMPSKRTPFSRLIAKGFFATIGNIIKERWRNARKTVRMIMPGSLFASVGMLITTRLYSLYIGWVSSDSQNFNILYGGLSSIVMLILWFYVLSFVIIIGIQLNAACAEYRDTLDRAWRVSGRMSKRLRRKAAKAKQGNADE